MREMNLTLELIHIKDIQFGETTQVKDHILEINKEELAAYLHDDRLQSIQIELARPGESVRIIPVKDVIEPRVKVDDEGNAFPGFLGECEGTGEGRTKVLKGVGVVTTGKIVGFQEGIIDMAGPAAEHCYYSVLNNVVIVAEKKDGVAPQEHETAIRLAGIKAAKYLASCAKNMDADETEVYQLGKTDKPLPKVAILFLAMAQGLLHDNYIYGVDAKKIHTTLLHPNELMDGALVSGNCVVASNKYTTYDHQNNPLVKKLYKRHGKELEFVGIIFTPSCPGLSDKKRCCTGAINIARTLGLDGLLLPEEGGGNPEADLMMLCRNAEKSGIRTVMIVGAIGEEEAITDTTPEADAVVNVGSRIEKMLLPKMDKVIGHEEQIKILAGGSEDSICPDGSLYVTVSSIMSMHNGMGMTKLTSKVY